MQFLFSHFFNFNLYILLAVYFISSLFTGKIKYYPLTENSTVPLVLVTGSYIVLIIILESINFDYSRLVLILNLVTSAIWLSFWVYLKKKISPVRIGYFNEELEEKLTNTHKFTFVNIKQDSNKLHGIIYDDKSVKDNNLRNKISEMGLHHIRPIKLNDILERSTGRISFDHIEDLTFEDFNVSSTYSLIKRLLDIVICLIGSPFLIILGVITAIGVRLDSPGPLFFTQYRTGKGDKPFKMYKFRSMRTDSEKDGAKFASTNDSRITKWGKFIRKVRLDEIPQFINILKGDMSLIGPRPEQKVFTDQFNEEIPFYPYRHAVRPGITGWAQVSQGYAATVEQTKEKVEYDLFYIKNFTLWLDLLIVLKTIRTVLTGFGAR